MHPDVFNPQVRLKAVHGFPALLSWIKIFAGRHTSLIQTVGPLARYQQSRDFPKVASVPWFAPEWQLVMVSFRYLRTSLQVVTGFQVDLWSAKPSTHLLASEQPKKSSWQERVVNHEDEHLNAVCHVG